MSDAPETVRCPGCGAALPNEEGPTHVYMQASPACWRRYGALLAAEFCGATGYDVHRLGVDAYAAQHPGDPNDRRAVQSVWIHLARLALQVDGLADARELQRRMVGFTRRKTDFAPLDPPRAFRITVADVAPFAGGPEHGRRVTAWARSVWEDWAAQHHAIRTWMNAP